MSNAEYRILKGLRVELPNATFVIESAESLESFESEEQPTPADKPGRIGRGTTDLPNNQTLLMFSVHTG